MRWALIVDSVVAAVVEQESRPALNGRWVKCGDAGSGWRWIGGTQFEPPQAPAVAWEAFDFYRRFTSAERIAIRALAQTDPIAADFIATLDATIASGARVLSNDPDLIAGLGYLQTQPAGSPVFTAGRVAELIAP